MLGCDSAILGYNESLPIRQQPRVDSRKGSKVGIRFRCHHCEFELHVKDFQAGKRGKCPTCKARFRIPLESSEYSLDADVELEAVGVKASESAEHASQDGVQASHATSDSSANEAASVATIEAPSDPQEPAAEEPAAQEPASQERSTEQPAPQSGLESTSPSTIAPPAQTLVPDRFREAPEAKWYVRPPAGGQYGPASLEDFEQWLSEKRVTHDSLIWREGWPEWLNAAKALPELFTTESPASLMPAAPAPALAPAPTPTAQQPGSSSVTGLNAIAGQGLAGQHSSVNSASVTIEKNRIEKKRRKKRNYTVMIAVLSVIAIVLIAALIIVLMYQGN